jgi:hypothetical protein
MYLTAQRVIAPTTQREGINAFCYRHIGQAWEHLSLADVPQDNPGILQASTISVAPAGNRVRSYLDVVTPDEVRWEEVHAALMEFVAHSQPTPLPWGGQSRTGYFRLGMERTLSPRWQKELAILYRAAQALWLAQSS